MCEKIALIFGVCRIGFYSLFQRLCCKKPPPPKHEISAVCIGITKAGKSTVLALLGGDTEEIQPTSGFSIKGLIFDDCILSVKEIGGNEKIRPYWHHYYKGAQGVIFVVDVASSDDDMAIVKAELSNAMVNPALRRLPLLILGTHQDQSGARSAEELTELLELSKNCEGRTWILHVGSTEDIPHLRSGFQQFTDNILKMYAERTEPNRI